MKILKTVLGRLAYSKAGRDKGNLVVVIGILDEAFVLVADGQKRRVENPKKKRLKHLDFTENVTVDLLTVIENGLKLKNSEIKKAIEKYKAEVI